MEPPHAHAGPTFLTLQTHTCKYTHPHTHTHTRPHTQYKHTHTHMQTKAHRFPHYLSFYRSHNYLPSIFQIYDLNSYPVSLLFLLCSFTLLRPPLSLSPSYILSLSLPLTF